MKKDKRRDKIKEYFNDQAVRDIIVDIFQEELASRPLKEQEEFFEKLKAGVTNNVNLNA